MLVDSDGEILFSIKGKKSTKSLYEIALRGDSELAQAFIKAKDSLKTQISDFEYYKVTNTAAVFIAAPVFKGAELIGAVIVQMGNDGIYSLIKNYTGLGKTGETIIAAKKKGRQYLSCPLDSIPTLPFSGRYLSVQIRE